MDDTADQIARLEAELDNTNRDGSLQNNFVSAFQKYTEVQEITSEIAADVLQEIRVYPFACIEIVWNYQEDLDRLLLDCSDREES